MNRREFLGHAAGAGAGLLAGRLDPAGQTGSVLGILSALGAPPTPDVDQYCDQTADLWTGGGRLDPAILAYQAADHVEHGQTLLTRASGPDRRRLADAVAMTTILVGRTTFFDLGRPRASEQVWRLAVEQLEGSANHPLLACLYGHAAFVPGWAGDWANADRYLQLAAGHARRGGGPGLRSWVHAVAAECLTHAGRAQNAIVRIERARETLAGGGAHDDPWWLDYYSAERLDGFDAAVALQAARSVLSRSATPTATRHALNRVERALGHLLPEPDLTQAGSQDCVTLLDRATGHALVHDDDQALRLAEAACRTLGQRPYHAAVQRLDTLADILPASRTTDLLEIERVHLQAA